MKHPFPPDSESALQLEAARRRAAHHTRDASRILVEVMHLAPFEDRATYAKIAGALQTAERQLNDLQPEAAP